MSVKKVRLCPEGPEISEIAFGTWRILDDEPQPSPADLARRLEKCLELGITTIDTAEMNMLLSGISLKSVRRRKRYREVAANAGVASREKKLVS